MLQQSIDELVAIAGNHYSLTIAAAKRARQLIDEVGDNKNVFNVKKPLSFATEEILQGRVEVAKLGCVEK